MARVVLLLAAAIGWPIAAHADIYKCVEPGAIIYQSRPCAVGQAQTLVSADKRPARASSAGAPPAPRAPAATSMRDVAFRHTTIALGIWDDEVLNMPGWGVPDRIERSREGHIYRESWMYQRPDGVRWLYFANSRLTGMETGDAPVERMIGLSTR